MGRGQLAAKPLLRLARWKFEDGVPAEKKYVCLAFPHTSNWDGALLVALAQSIGLELSWMIKSEWTRGPMGVALRPLGAIGIDRSGSHRKRHRTYWATTTRPLVMKPA
jgi:1-acyl-sn-glycerol-3-phosphate acyltransferase